MSFSDSASSEDYVSNIAFMNKLRTACIWGMPATFSFEYIAFSSMLSTYIENKM